MLKTFSSRSPRALATVLLAIALLILPSQVTGTPRASAAGGPALVSTPRLSIIDYQTIILTYNSLIAPTHPTTSLFEVKVNGVTVPVRSVSVPTNSNWIHVLLESVVTAGQTLTISYLAPTPVAGTTNAAVQDSSGNDAAAFPETVITHSSNVSALSVPPAPTIVPGPESATATVTAPASGAQPSWHRVYASPGGGKCDIETPSGSCTISGLTAGTAYIFAVRSFDNLGVSTALSPTSTPITALAKTAAAVTETVPAGTTETVPAGYTPSWDKEPLTDSETDSNTVGYMPTKSPGTIIITDEFGFTLDKNNGIKPKIRMKNYAGKIKMSISATYKVGAKNVKYKCAFTPFGTTKKIKTAKWRWYSPKKACVLPAPLVAAIRANKATLSTSGKWTRQALTTGKKVRADNSRIKARNLKYKVKAKV